jgi:hypothetical protein
MGWLQPSSPRKVRVNLFWSTYFGVNPYFEVIVALIIAVLGIGRVVRLITYDDFPPSVWWRIKWATWTNDGPWTKVFTCLWCFSPYATLGCIGFFVAGLWVPWIAVLWWVLFGWAALSYAVSMVVVRDDPAD